MKISNWPEWLWPANVLTELRILSVPVMVAEIASRHLGWALFLFAIAAISDWFDGRLARRFGQESSLGLYLDPAADKLLLSALFITLSAIGSIPWAITAVLITRDLTVTVTAFLFYRKARFGDFAPLWVGKARTTSELLTICFALMYGIWPFRVFLGIEMVGWLGVIGFTVASAALYTIVTAERYHAFQQHA